MVGGFVCLDFLYGFAILLPSTTGADFPPSWAAVQLAPRVSSMILAGCSSCALLPVGPPIVGVLADDYHQQWRFGSSHRCLGPVFFAWICAFWHLVQFRTLCAEMLYRSTIPATACCRGYGSCGTALLLLGCFFCSHHVCLQLAVWDHAFLV